MMRRLALPLMLLLMPGAAAAADGGSAFRADELTALAFHQHPGAPLPRDLRLTDATGHPVRLGDLIAGKPVVLALDYFRCRTLCGFVLANLADALAQVPLRAGRDYAVLAVSIDPRDGPAESTALAAKYAAQAGEGAGWHFLTQGPDAVAALAEAVGFPYRFDAAADQYAHPAGVTIVAPDGRVARYVLGIDYRPLDLRLALAEAGRGTIAAPVSDLLLLCYCYDPETGRYSSLIGTAMRILGALTVAGLLVLLARLARPRRA